MAFLKFLTQFGTFTVILFGVKHISANTFLTRKKSFFFMSAPLVPQQQGLDKPHYLLWYHNNKVETKPTTSSGTTKTRLGQTPLSPLLPQQQGWEKPHYILWYYNNKVETNPTTSFGTTTTRLGQILLLVLVKRTKRMFSPSREFFCRAVKDFKKGLSFCQNLFFFHKFVLNKSMQYREKEYTSIFSVSSTFSIKVEPE